MGGTWHLLMQCEGDIQHGGIETHDDIISASHLYEVLLRLTYSSLTIKLSLPSPPLPTPPHSPILCLQFQSMYEVTE